MSLKYRIALVIFILEAMMMTVIFGYTLTKTQQVNSKQFVETEKVILDILGSLSRVALITMEYGELRPYIEFISKDPQVARVLVLNHKGFIVASSNPVDIGKPVGKLETSKNTSWRKQALANEIGPLGTVLVNYTHDNLIQVNRDVIKEGMIIALAGMIIIAVVGLITGALLTRRLEIVSSAAKRISKGELDVKTGMRGKDEISLLGQLFDQMAISIKVYIQELKSGKMALKKAQDELETKVAERTSELQHVALHDQLTGLANRSLFMDSLSKALLQLKRDESLAVMMIDLDRFKSINDELGHATGDAVLREVAHRFSETFRHTDTVARLGGDEFAILLPDTNLVSAKIVAANIMNALVPHADIDGHELSLACSIGIAIYPEHAKNSSQLLQCADVAMYTAKRNRWGFTAYKPEQDSRLDINGAISSELKQAIIGDKLELFYQAKVSPTTGQLTGAEALIRWNHNGELLLPNAFLPLAEQAGMQEDINIWVIQSAIHQCLKWNQCSTPVSVSINISTKCLEKPRIKEYLLKSVEKYNLNPKQLMLELTESDISSDTSNSIELLNKLNQRGFGISLDDFGVGSSSLSCLNKLSVDEVKIDRTFVSRVSEDSNVTAIVQSIIEMAHRLDMQVVAEGVENEISWETLKVLGCDSCQGFYTGKPMPADKFAALFLDCNDDDEINDGRRCN